MDRKIALLLFTLSAIVLSVSAVPGKGPIESEINLRFKQMLTILRDFFYQRWPAAALAMTWVPR